MRLEDFALYRDLGTNGERRSDEVQCRLFIGEDGFFPCHIIERISLRERVMGQAELLQRFLIEGISGLMLFANTAHSSHVTERTAADGKFGGTDTCGGNERSHRLNRLIRFAEVLSLLIIRVRRLL